MLAYYVAFELAPQIRAAAVHRRNAARAGRPRHPADRSPSAKAKAASATTTDGFPAHSLADLLADLGTLCRNKVRIGAAQRTFTRLTKPSDFQARALELLGVKLGA